MTPEDKIPEQKYVVYYSFNVDAFPIAVFDTEKEANDYAEGKHSYYVDEVPYNPAK